MGRGRRKNRETQEQTHTLVLSLVCVWVCHETYLIMRVRSYNNNNPLESETHRDSGNSGHLQHPKNTEDLRPHILIITVFLTPKKEE